MGYIVTITKGNESDTRVVTFQSNTQQNAFEQYFEDYNKDAQDSEKYSVTVVDMDENTAVEVLAEYFPAATLPI